MADAGQAPKKPMNRLVQKGRVYIRATFNNTLVTITDETGNTLCWGSTGNSGFSGSRKSTPYAATVSLEKAMNKAKEFGMRYADVYIKGPGPGRDAALRVLKASGVRVTMLVDMTPVPHNGVKPRKLRHG